MVPHRGDPDLLRSVKAGAFQTHWEIGWRDETNDHRGSVLPGNGGESLAWAGPLSPAPGPAADSPSDAVDDVILGEMRKRHVAGLSLAIIQDGKIVKARGYGVTERGGDSPVTTTTLFQAGSISKSVSALGAAAGGAGQAGPG